MGDLCCGSHYYHIELLMFAVYPSLEEDVEMTDSIYCGYMERQEKIR